jgi:hypothetical protein
MTEYENTPLDTETLKDQATEQRMQLKASLDELRARVRETLDVERSLRSRIFLISGITALVAFSTGFGLTGIFSGTRR